MEERRQVRGRRPLGFSPMRFGSAMLIPFLDTCLQSENLRELVDYWLWKMAFLTGDAVKINVAIRAYLW